MPFNNNETPSTSNTNNTSIPSQTQSFMSHSNENDQNQIHQQHNGFVPMKSATLPSLPLPVVSNQLNQTNKNANTNQPRLSLPLPPAASPFEMEDEDQQTINQKNQNIRRRPRILNKVAPLRPIQEPRCVDVFKIICQIGEGTYGQVYKACDQDNW